MPGFVSCESFQGYLSWGASSFIYVGRLSRKCRESQIWQSHERRRRLAWSRSAPYGAEGFVVVRIHRIAFAGANFIRGYFRTIPPGRNARPGPLWPRSWRGKKQAADLDGRQPALPGGETWFICRAWQVRKPVRAWCLQAQSAGRSNADRGQPSRGKCT